MFFIYLISQVHLFLNWVCVWTVFCCHISNKHISAVSIQQYFIMQKFKNSKLLRNLALFFIYLALFFFILFWIKFFLKVLPVLSCNFFLYLVDKWAPPKKKAILSLTLIWQVLFAVSHVKTVLETLSLCHSISLSLFLSEPGQ